MFKVFLFILICYLFYLFISVTVYNPLFLFFSFVFNSDKILPLKYFSNYDFNYIYLYVNFYICVVLFYNSYPKYCERELC